MAVSNKNLIRALVCGGGDGGGGDGVQTKNITLKFREYNNKYMYQGNKAY